MRSSPELSGRLAVVTGATSGIGRATSARLAASGVRVIVAARSAARVQRAADEVGGIAIAADIATEPGVRAIADAVREQGVHAPDVVVHAAGAFQLAPVAQTDLAVFDEMIAVNLRAAFLLARTFVPAMLERGSGDIVAIGSVAGRHAFPSNGAYSASKFGVRGLFAVLAAELRGSGVRASLVEPTATDTPLWDAVDRDANPDLPRRTDMLSPDAVAEAVLYAVTRPRDVVIPNILVERA